MKRNLHTIILLCLLCWNASAQIWELQLNTDHNADFQAAYQAYPNIPKGILEAVAYTNTHIRHVQPQQEQSSCVGLPEYYGVMGLVNDGQGYFKNNLQTVAQLSGYSAEQIQYDPYINILAYAKAYSQLMENHKINSSSPEDHIAILDELSELPNDGQTVNNFAFDSHLYSIFKNLNDAKFQKTYQVPVYQLDLEKIFGKERYQILSSSGLILDENGVRTDGGNIYNNQGLRAVLAPPCSDLSVGFPYPVIQDGADPTNYSSRLGVAITHITIHTMQGTYAGAISWFKNPVADVSAHYNMRASDGQITQMVCEIDKAWHVGNSNPYAVGIEHEGYIDDPSWYTNIMYVVSAELSKDIALRNGIQLIRTYDKNGDNGTNPISDGCFKIKGHQHFPSQTHVDPGEFWDWNRYYDLINPTSLVTTNTFTTCAGSFTDPGGAGNYANDARVFYKIQPTGATSVTVNFTAFNLELNYDYLYVYNGDSHNDPLIAILNGTSIPAAITASSGKMFLEFRSDCGTTAAGWSANWTCSSAAISCAIPTGLTTSSHNQNGATLQWNVVPGAIKYQIKVKQTIGTLGYSTYYSTTNSYVLTGLASDAKYLWQVRAICGVGDTSVAEGSEFINVQPTTSVTTTACSGEFTDSGGPLGKYRKNENYTYTIAPTGATSVTLTFSAFNTELNYDFVRIYDGLTTASPLLGTYSGTTIPPVITSSGGSLTIRFTSDVATQNAGWIATWTCVDAPIIPTYGNPILLDTTMLGNLNCGLTYHDYYDSGNSAAMYSNNEDYVQTFCNPDASKAVRLSFRPNPTAAQQLTISSTNSSNDYLYFYNGPNTNSNLIGVYTGASSTAPQPGTFISSGSCMTVRMSSDAAAVGNGWIARLYCSDPPANLGTITVGGTAGTKVFRDLGGVANYTNNANYTITYCPDATAPVGQGVWAEFVGSAGIESNWDYLYIFDGPDTDNSKLIGIYTGNTTNLNTLKTIKASVQNPTGCLTFQFFSDGATNAAGWEANMFTGERRLAYGSEDCSNATFISQTGRDYAGSTTTATGSPGIIDPALNIAIASLPGCSGANSITRLENTIWYRFITPDTMCVPTSMHLKFNNISCQSEGAGGSGVQMALYQVSSCALGAAWTQPVYCADKILSGDSVNVASVLQPNTSYYLMVDGFTGQHCNFDLRFDVLTAGDPLSCLLPLELLTFTGNALPNNNRLKWETAHEDNVLGFYVQRNVQNGIDFEDIGFVASNPTSAQHGALYQYDDVNYWRNAVNYYRLRQLDNSGLQSFSPIVSIDRRTNQNELPLKVYPNPSKDWIVFALDNPSESDYSLRIYDITGRIVYEQNGEMAVGYWTEQLNTSTLAAGMYVYQLQIGMQALYGKFEKN